jgi:hypothetical protein
LTGLEVASLSVAALYMTLRSLLDPQRGVVALRLVAIAAAAVVGELTVVGLYDFYGFTIYPWKLVVAVGTVEIPLAVPLIWPVVVHTAWDLARRLEDSASVARVALVASGLVLTDALLIEPIAVRFGMWSWHEPGVFGPGYAVPPIGVIGWAFFALGLVVILETWERAAAARGHARYVLALLIAAPALLHPLLLVLWWGALRWVNVDLPPWPGVALAWAASIVLTLLALRARRGTRWQVLACIPGAVFFCGLLALSPNATLPLVVWSAAIGPPYLALLARGPGSPEKPASA